MVIYLNLKKDKYTAKNREKNFKKKDPSDSSRIISQTGDITMNKADLVEKIASQTGLTKRACREAIDTISSVITDSLARGEKVTLVSFGSFRVVKRKARRGRNPQTGQEIKIPAKDVVRFRPGKAFEKTFGPTLPSPPPSW